MGHQTREMAFSKVLLLALMWSVTAKPINEAKINADDTMIGNDDTDKDFVNSIAEVGLERFMKKNATTGNEKMKLVYFSSVQNGKPVRVRINFNDRKNLETLAALIEKIVSKGI